MTHVRFFQEIEIIFLIIILNSCLASDHQTFGVYSRSRQVMGGLIIYRIYRKRLSRELNPDPIGPDSPALTIRTRRKP